MEFQPETIYYSSSVLEELQEGTSYLISYKKWSGMSFCVYDLETQEQIHENEEYFTHSLPNHPKRDEYIDYLKQNYKGSVVCVHFYRYLCFDYNPTTGYMFQSDYEAGETYVDTVYITEDGADLIYV